MNLHKLFAPVIFFVEIASFILAFLQFFNGSLAIALLSGLLSFGCYVYLSAFRKQHGYRYKSDLDVGEDALD